MLHPNIHLRSIPDLDRVLLVRSSKDHGAHKLMIPVCAGSDAGKQVLLSVQGIAVLAIIVYSLVSKPPAVAQAKDAATKAKDLNDY